MVNFGFGKYQRATNDGQYNIVTTHFFVHACTTRIVDDVRQIFVYYFKSPV